MNKKLGLMSLTALVLSSMVGAGVFSLPQNMAEVASPAALIIGWIITGVGILFLALSLLLLSRLRPDLDGGIFTYAKEGFGEFIGFCSAWGYWVCAVVANVSYLVIVFAAVSFFTDSPNNIIFGDGNTWQALLGESILLWVVHFLVLRGVQTAASINLMATMAKLIPLGLFIIVALLAFNMDIFTFDFEGIKMGVPIWEQVKNTMLITLWVSELAMMKNPSMAPLLVQLIGNIGEIVIAAGLILSVCGAYLSWTIMAAEVPYIAALHHSFPKQLSKQNHNDAPSSSLWFTNLAVQLSLVLIWLTGSNYNTLLTIASEMILVPYFLVGAFLFKVAIERSSRGLLLIAIPASLYGLWLLYASGVINLLLSVVLYAPGVLIFLYSRKQYKDKQSLNTSEKILLMMVLIGAIPACGYLVFN
ncbi:amino acid permease [Proteus mirabilis]|uniref:amino acid permease n=1 Tax=Proteus mirabilis TaxID=584 RepID=UPI0039C5C8A0